MAHYKIRLNNQLFDLDNEDLIFGYSETFNDKNAFTKEGKYKSKTFTFTMSYKNDTNFEISTTLKNCYDYIYSLLSEGNNPLVHITLIETIVGTEQELEVVLFHDTINDIMYNITPTLNNSKKVTLDNINIELIFLNLTEINV